MAFEDYDELEEGERVRKWIRENGIAVGAGIVLALVLIFGWRQWQAHEVKVEVQAAAQFAVVENAVNSGDHQAMSAALGDLQKNFAKSAYAGFASAAVAKYDTGKGNLKAADTNLAWALAHASQPALKGLFALRLAQVQLAQKQAQPALDTLGRIPAGDYVAGAAELRGDALLELGKPDAARSAYQDALAKLDKDAPGRGFLEMKLENLSQSPAASTGKQAQ